MTIRDTKFTAEVPLGDSTTTVGFFHTFKRGVDRVFVDHPLFLERVWGMSKQKLYGPKWGADYEDNQLRFSMFCKAAMAATKSLKLAGSPYGQNVIFVANDWHAALLPMYLKQVLLAPPHTHMLVLSLSLSASAQLPPRPPFSLSLSLANKRAAPCSFSSPRHCF